MSLLLLFKAKGDGAAVAEEVLLGNLQWKRKKKRKKKRSEEIANEIRHLLEAQFNPEPVRQELEIPVQELESAATVIENGKGEDFEALRRALDAHVSEISTMQSLLKVLRAHSQYIILQEKLSALARQERQILEEAARKKAKEQDDDDLLLMTLLH